MSESLYARIRKGDVLTTKLLEDDDRSQMAKSLTPLVAGFIAKKREILADSTQKLDATRKLKDKIEQLTSPEEKSREYSNFSQLNKKQRQLDKRLKKLADTHLNVKLKYFGTPSKLVEEVLAKIQQQSQKLALEIDEHKTEARDLLEKKQQERATEADLKTQLSEKLVHIDDAIKRMEQAGITEGYEFKKLESRKKEIQESLDNNLKMAAYYLGSVDMLSHP